MGRRSNYTAKQKTEVVLSVLTKQTTIVRSSRHQRDDVHALEGAGAGAGDRSP